MALCPPSLNRPGKSFHRSTGTEGWSLESNKSQTCCCQPLNCWRSSPQGLPYRHPLPMRLAARSEEHTSELQSLMRISYAVFCLKKKKNNNTKHDSTDNQTRDK